MLMIMVLDSLCKMTARRSRHRGCVRARTIVEIVMSLQPDDMSDQEWEEFTQSIILPNSASKPVVRTAQEVWDAIEHLRRKSGKKIRAWKKSYEGVKAAVEYCGYKLHMTKKEFKAVKAPRHSGHGNGPDNSRRKIIVSRNGIVCHPVEIGQILTGKTSFLTPEELNEMNEQKSLDGKKRRVKGETVCQQLESDSINTMNKMIGTNRVLVHHHLYEFRLADVAYRRQSSKHPDLYVADQVKSAHCGTCGKLNFHMKIADIVWYLRQNMSVTFIGLCRLTSRPLVVWYFIPEDIEALLQFNQNSLFHPVLFLQYSIHPFTVFYSDPRYRYDIGLSKLECERLLNRKVYYARTGPKNTLQFLNEDFSQIPHKNHQVEQRSISMTQDACRKIGATVDRLHDDANSSRDFRLNYATSNVRVQDKVFVKNKYPRTGLYVNFRGDGKYPYNPDDIDIIQFTNIDEKTVYAIPMRKFGDDDLVESFFSAKELLCQVLSLSKEFRCKYQPYFHDLNTRAGIKSYVEACESYSRIPPLSDSRFYTRIIEDEANQHLYESYLTKQRRLNRQAIRDAKAAADEAAYRSDVIPQKSKHGPGDTEYQSDMVCRQEKH